MAARRSTFQMLRDDKKRRIERRYVKMAASPHRLRLRSSYLVATTGYGFSRKVCLSRSHKEDPSVVRLTTDRVAVCTFGAVCAVWMWPWYAFKDLRRFEVVMRGLEPARYGYTKPRYTVDYFWE